MTIIHKVTFTDIVRIRNGEVCYWSNLGYGKFDKKITLLGNERRTGHVKALYYDENLINHLPLGEAAYHGILYKSRQLVLSQSMKNTFYAGFSEVTDSLLEGGGYEKIGTDFYLPSSVYIYDADAFYTVIKSTDPFGEETSFAWDDYSFFPIQTEDALGNVTTSEIDYRVLDYWQMTDANGNRTALAFDTLGLVHKTAVNG